MKVLSISKGGGEIARAHLRRPMVTIGRAPSCDFILRAPGVSPVHFLLEWAGKGKFDPLQNVWTVVDISPSVEEISGEGILLDETSTGCIADFSFRFIDDSLESHSEIGGRIQENLMFRNEVQKPGKEMLEVVQIRSDSGAVEEVLHLRPKMTTRLARPLKQVPEFKIQWQRRDQGLGILKVLSEEMPGAKIHVLGQEVRDPTSSVLGPRDLLEVHWRGRAFYLRLVPKMTAPVLPRSGVDPLKKKITLVTGALVLLLALLSRIGSSSKVEELAEPPRVARIQTTQIEQPVAEVSSKTVEPDKIPNPAAASKVEEKVTRNLKSPTAVVNPGLNSPANVTNINQVGILGALNNGGNKGKGVRADQVMNNGVVTDFHSGESAPVLVKSPPAGVLTAGQGGGGARSGPGLTAASTTLAGAGKYDPSSTEPIAAKGKGVQAQIGSELSADENEQNGNSLDPSNDVGTNDEGFNTEGGLDRESVRKVIRSHSNQIRTCYERALLVQAGVQGRILYQWLIDPSGSVATVSKMSSSVTSENLVLCVQDVIRGMVFPKSGNASSTRVKYPFVFQPIH